VKKLSIFFLILILVLSLAGCGVKEKIENKVGEKIAEKVLESASGDKNTKVDISDGKVTIKDKESGTEATFGGTEWPKEIPIPVFKGGKVSSVVHDGKESSMIMLEEVEKKDFENYCQEIKKDFTEDVFEMTSGEALSFAAENSKGFVVQLTYDSSAKVLTIITAQNN